jgi:soluble lytic murein transglycosylase-like protein
MRITAGQLVLLVAATAALAPARAEAQIYTRLNSRGVIEATNVPDTSDFLLTYPGKGTLIHSRGFRRQYRGEFDSHIQAAASAFGVAVDLVKAVIQVESEFDHLAVSSKGAQGLMQLMPFTARRFGVTDVFDPRQNVFSGVQFLRYLLDLFRGDVDLTLAAYNAGENAVLRHKGIPPYRETRAYVQKIRALISGTVALTRMASAQALSFTPSTPALRQPSSRVTPVRPRVYYKFVDDRGLLHVSQAPPQEGVSYSLLRALD